MQRENRIMILTGLLLVAATMFYGFYYAVFDEHQTLAGMGMSLATGFINAASGDLVAANAALDQYGAIAREYKLEIHFHGHLGFLCVVLVLMGLVMHTLNLSEAARVRLAYLLAASAAAFPLGVALQIGPLNQLGSVFAAAGSVGLIIGMLVFAIGVMRKS